MGYRYRTDQFRAAGTATPHGNARPHCAWTESAIPAHDRTVRSALIADGGIQRHR
jgi:hypothetical protein